MKNVLWKPELWIPLDVQQIDEKKVKAGSSPVKSFFDYQDLREAYEVRGILPRARLTFRDQD